MHFDGHSLELDLGLTHSYYARIEIVSPLGVRLALLQINQEFVQLFMIRDNTVYRFPTAEFFKDTVRRARFLTLLPVRIIPELFFDAVLNRVALGSPKAFDCRYDSSENIYIVRIVEEGSLEEGRWVELDPNTYSPLKVLYFPQKTPALNSEGGRALYEVNFKLATGQGISTLQSSIEFSDANLAPNYKRKGLRFEWIRAEAWENRSPEAFQWRPSASTYVKDY